MARTTRTRLQPFITPTGAVVTAETISAGDTVLVWSHASPDAPKPTWGPVAPYNTRWPAPARRAEYKAEEAVVCRFDRQWHATAARRGITLGTIVSTRPQDRGRPPIWAAGDRPPVWPDGTVDVAMSRSDLLNGHSLAFIDIDNGAPRGLGGDFAGEQLKHFGDAARNAGYHISSVAWPPSADALPDQPGQYLPEKLVLWRSKGVPLHIRTLRRLAELHGTAPHPDNTAIHDLHRMLRAGDQLDCHTRADTANGQPAHASGIGANSRHPAYVAEIDSEWWHSAYDRGAAFGVHLATTDKATALVAMTADDFESSMGQARKDLALPGPQRANAIAAFDALEFQYDDIRNIAPQIDDPEFAAAYTDEYGDLSL